MQASTNLSPGQQDAVIKLQGTGNRVRTLKYTGSHGVGVRGISLYPGNMMANITVRNNAVSDFTADDNDATLANQLMGIGVLSGAGYSIYNSVQLDGELAANAFNKVAAALFVANGATGLDVRNNVLSNVQTVAVAASLPGTNYAVYAEGTSSPFTLIDYNLYDLAKPPSTWHCAGPTPAATSPLRLP